MMETWLIIVLIVFIVFILCMIIGFFGDKYFEKKDIEGKQNELQDSSGSKTEQQVQNIKEQNLNSTKNVTENNLDTQMIDNSMVIAQPIITQGNDVVSEQFVQPPINETPQAVSTNMLTNEPSITGQNLNNVTNMTNNVAPVQTVNGQFNQSVQNGTNTVNNVGAAPMLDGQLQQNPTGSLDPNLVPFDGNFSADDNVNNVF